MGAAVLAEGPLNDDQSEAVEMMTRSARRMSELIDDTLDFTGGRLGGGITLESRSDQPLEPVVRHVIAEARTLWPTRTIHREFALLDPVRFDRKRMAQLELLGVTARWMSSRNASDAAAPVGSAGGAHRLYRSLVVRTGWSDCGILWLIPRDSKTRRVRPSHPLVTAWLPANDDLSLNFLFYVLL